MVHKIILLKEILLKDHLIWNSGNPAFLPPSKKDQKGNPGHFLSSIETTTEVA